MGIAPWLLGIDTSASGVRGRAPAEKKTYFITKHLWLIDNIVFYNTVIQRSLVDLTSSAGKDSPPWPNLETVCLHPPSVEGPDFWWN